MIGVIVPAHNEEALIGNCLASIQKAACQLGNEEVCTFVALDRCRDRTAEIAARWGAHLISAERPNVGHARAAAAQCALDHGARWIASTDADSHVPADWLVGQLAAAADAFLGTVEVADWESYGAGIRARFLARQHYRDGHPHVHGANLGVSAVWYQRCGGFAPVAAHEDVDLVRSLEAAGASIARLARPRVITSARQVARAHEGFAAYLQGLRALPDSVL